MLSVTAWSRKSVLNLTNHARLRAIPVGRFWEQTKCLPFYRSFGSFENDKQSCKTASPSLQFLREIGHASNTPGNQRSNWEKVSLSARGCFASVGAVGALLLFLYWFDPINHDVQHVTQKLDDVKGVDEVKREMKQLVEFLRDPKKYASFGVKLPKVVLLVGEPGTGKTMLGKAVAGEAQVPYFYLHGPELAEMEIGLALRRVNGVYESAKAHSPCILMVHKIDSVGCKNASSAKRPFVNHIMNQLLAEIERIGENEGVLTIASTSPQERGGLDEEELLHVGGLGIVVDVPLPDVKGRKEILEKYVSKVKCGCDVPLERIARETLGFTGGQLEEMMEEARLRAFTGDAGCKSLAKMDVDYGRKRVIEDCQKKGIRILSEEEKYTVAYHEAGHTLMTLLTEGQTRLKKVTIIPIRRKSNGHTSYVPETTGHHTRTQKLAFMRIVLGGKAAEALLLGGDHKVTAGVQGDMRVVHDFGRTVVRMSRNSSSLGVHSSIKHSNTLEQIGDSALGTTETGSIDMEVKKLVDELYIQTKSILHQHSKQLKALADALLKYETLDAERVKQIIAECDFETDLLMPKESQNLNDIV